MRTCIAVAAALLVAEQDAGAQTVEATRVQQPIALDGRLDEPAWAAARFHGDFRQREPQEGAPATEATEFAILFERDALVVGARMAGADAVARPRITRRDDGADSDRVLFSIDPVGDGLAAYTLGVTSGGVRLDVLHPGDSESSRDATFDPVWEARVHREAAGWTAELRIPLAQLRVPSGGGSYGVNVTRVIPALNERSYFVLVPRIEAGWASRFARMAPPSDLDAAAPIGLRPYVNAAMRDAGTADRSNALSFGTDATAGIGRWLTLQATVNPDFGQVEADPATINLTAFETVLSERRPFFTDATRFFSGGSYFYSRRIGAAPVGVRTPGAIIEQPNNTTILGAARITGTVPSGAQVGALAAVTAREFITVTDTDAPGGTSELLVSPLTAFGVVRTTLPLTRSSFAGLWLTGVHRDMHADDPVAPVLARNAFAAGTDATVRFGDYEVRADAGLSHVRGSEAAILRLQQSSTRYFQQPDASHIDVDAARTALSGARGSVAVERRAGRHWLWSASSSAVSPEFEVNDVGRSTRSDLVNAHGRLVYRETQPSRLLRDYRIELEAEHAWNFGGLLRQRTYEFTGNLTFPDFSSFSMHVHVEPRRIDDRLTRGGPLARTGTFRELSLSYDTNPARSTQLELGTFLTNTSLGNRTQQASIELSSRLGSRLQLSVEARGTRDINTRQFVAAESGGPAETYGSRFIFGRVVRTTFSFPILAEYAFVPELSLQLYAHPFASSGAYTGFGQLERAGGSALVPLDASWIGSDVVIRDGAQTIRFADPDFNVQSLRTNAVLRWEWRPGSVLYAVWQQDRSGPVDGRHAAALDAVRALDAPGRHYLAIKAVYWLEKL